MPSHRAVHIESAGAPLTLADVDTPAPARDQVRIAVAAWRGVRHRPRLRQRRLPRTDLATDTGA
ncbi:hypothetical protein C1Y40_05847 [Mycobacterium talmoniae]|uniref:Uncharacterized protein n=1 Tax=Mycobacterium talmoniae TaxID=1858794 RepID=A0A2S8BBG3_9MYCO|nr:hypothetical protein C1Y40_05847 [Mycobacterium talmoniae]